MQAIQEATSAAKVNVAILGNRDAHVHAHLISRFPENEEFPDCSPWNDLRVKEKIPADQVAILKSNIFIKYLTSIIERAAKKTSPLDVQLF